MTLLLRDDKGVLHPVQKDLLPDACLDLIRQAKTTCLEIDDHPPIMARAAKGSRRFVSL